MGMISVVGLYLSFSDYDVNPLFSGLQVPNGVDKDVVINNILSECAEFEILYPDADFMCFMIEQWSKKELPVWQKLYDTTILEYDPITNFDRTEEITETGSNTLNSTSTGSGTAGRNSHAENGFTGEDAETVAGFNAEDFVNSKKNNTSNTNDTTVTESNDYSNTDTGTTKQEETRTRKTRMFGNIGVTTSQQMIEQEREVVKFNIIDYIVDSFKRRFCLMIY